MGIVSRGGGGGSSVVEVSEIWTPSAGTPSSIADGATLDAGLLTGWKVADPNGALNSVVDDGGKLTVGFDQGGGATTALYSANFQLTQPTFRYPSRLFGDFTFSMYVRNTGSTAPGTGGNTSICVSAGDGTVSNQCHASTHMLGKWLTATAKYFGYGSADSGYLTFNGTSALARTTARWVGLKRTEGELFFGEGGTGASPSWSWTTSRWDNCGGAPWMMIGLYAGSAVAESYELLEVRLDGFVYTANPAA